MRASLIIPAFNEEERLPALLAELAAFHAEHAGSLEEVLVVDDGSADRTSAQALTFAGRLPLRLLKLPENRGKGAAVRAGIREARGDVVVFMDADGATSPREIPKLLAALERAPIAAGNRWIRGASVAGRTPFRAFSGWIYRTYVSFFGLRGIDTMCGFKGFHMKTARALFAQLREERWLFDTEIMLRARKRGEKIASVPIAWTSKRGSKLRLPVLIASVFQIPLLALRVRRELSSPPPPQFTVLRKTVNKQLRVLVVSALPPERSSSVGRTFPLARAVAAAGHDVELLTLSGAEDPPFAHTGILQGIRVRVVGPSLRATTVPHPSAAVTLSRWRAGRAALAAALRETSPDVIVLEKPQLQNTPPTIAFARQRGIPLLLDADDLEAEASRLPGAIEWYARILEASAARTASAITACSPFLVERYRRLNPAARVELLPTGIEIPAAMPLANLRARRRIPSGVPIILYVGSLSLSSGHRLDLLLDAFARITPQLGARAPHLLIAGDGIDAEKLRKAVSSRVHFLGRFTPPEDLALAREADLLVDPVDATPLSEAKSSHRVMLALATGTPVVAGAIGIRPFLLPPSLHDACLYDARREGSGALADALRRALLDERLPERFRAATAGLIEQWTWATLGRRFVELLERLAPRLP